MISLHHCLGFSLKYLQEEVFTFIDSRLTTKKVEVIGVN